MLTPKPQTIVWRVTVKDRYCGVKGLYDEEIEVITEAEADGWFRQWRREYPADSGYAVRKVMVEVKGEEVEPMPEPEPATKHCIHRSYHYCAACSWRLFDAVGDYFARRLLRGGFGPNAKMHDAVCLLRAGMIERNRLVLRFD